MLERAGGSRDDRGQVLGDLLGNDRFLVLAQGGCAALDARGLGLHPRAHCVCFSHAARADGIGICLAVEPCGRGLRFSLDFGRAGGRFGREPDALRIGLGLANGHVARCSCQRRLLVRLGVGRLAYVDLELLFLLVGLELGDLGLLLDDRLAGGCLGEWALLLGVLVRGIDLGLEAGLLDLRVAHG